MPEPNNLPDNFWDTMNQGLQDNPDGQVVTPPVEVPVVPANEPATPQTPPVEPTKPVETLQTPDPNNPNPNPETPPTETTTVENDADAQTLYEDFVKLGLIKHVEFEDGTPITQDTLAELMQSDRDEDVRLQLEQYFEQLDPRLKPIITFVSNGGSLDSYFTTQSNEFDFNQDVKEANVQNDMIRFYEKQILGFNDEQINDRIKLYETGNTKEATATQYQKLLKQAHVQQEQALQAEQAKKAEEAKRAYETDVNNITSALKKDTILGLKLSPKDRTELQGFIIDKNIQLQDGTKATSFQYELHKALQDPEKRILIAQLVRDDLKLDKIAKNYTTEKTQAFRVRVKTTQQKPDDNSSPFAGLNNQLT
jgi:hypothetical protein